MRACQQPGVDPDWFFPERGDVTAMRLAKSICVACPVRRACYVEAEIRKERFGIWGGVSFSGPKARRSAQAAML